MARTVQSTSETIEKHESTTLKQKTFKVKQIKTERYKKSAVPYMTELLNNDAAKRRRIVKETD